MFALLIFLIFLNVAIFKDPSFVAYASVFTLPFVASTAYAITRYRLMDIRFVVVRSVLFSVLVGTFFLLYGLLIWAATEIAVLRGVRLTPGVHALVAVAVSAVAILGFQWYRAFLQRVTDRVFFKGRYDYRQTLLALGQSLSETIDIDKILSLLTQTLRDTVKVDKVLVFTRDASGKEFIVRSATIAEGKNLRMTSDAPILRHLRHRPGLLVRDELSFFLEREDPRHDVNEIREIKTAFTWLDAALIMPLVVKGEISGLVLLGDKRSGDPFSSEDLELLATLAPQAATAIENARLYREAQEFGRKLEREVARATADLRVANEQLAQLDKAKSEFLSIASHQLYTPLTAIKGYLAMVQEEDFGKVAPKQKPIIDILRQSSDRLIDLIRNLLDVSRIESGRLELSLESLDLVAVARDLVTELTPNAERKDLVLEFHAPEGKVTHVVADAQRLRQVLLNILDNAIKYTDKGRIDVRVVREENALIYSVQDTGKGIAPDELGHLFTKFTRVGGAERYHTEGTGLGLYVAQQIVREHHGDIWAESAGRSHGATFFVKLPVEGSKNALTAGAKFTVGIKAAEAGEKST
jgi:signal transduction histidine kinase